MRIFIGIDNTICTVGDLSNERPVSTEDGYEECEPVTHRISKINELFEGGHYIVYWTARGSKTGNDYEELTRSQLKTWNAKHHEIIFGKPDYDVFIDSKSINDNTFFIDEET